MVRALDLSHQTLRKMSLGELEALIDQCSTQAERDVVADEWGKKRRQLDAESEHRANRQAAIYHDLVK